MTYDSLIYIKYILNSIKEIEDDVKGYSKNRFLASRKTQKSVILGLEIIGEATKNLPREFKERIGRIIHSLK